VACYNCVSRFLVALDGKSPSSLLSVSMLIDYSGREKRNGNAEINKEIV
jgi:hypothetical protein